MQSDHYRKRHEMFFEGGRPECATFGVFMRSILIFHYNLETIDQIITAPVWMVIIVYIMKMMALL